MMKRILAFCTVLMMLVSFSGCSRSFPKEDMEQTLAEFTEALKGYDREKMTSHLTEFPDHSQYVYLDDIFNDEAYMELYQLLYPQITYTVQSATDHQLIVDVTMPNVQMLYTNVMTLVLQMAMEDGELQQKLSESDENGIVLIQELMLAYVRQGNEVETMTQTFTLSFDAKDGKPVIVCDDQLRALITGNFFLSKNSTLAEIGND
ncbi:MAG: hypothetical protein IJ333_08645 [Clostridia bacterium]|nr:hypothetical protein [Clostridia bacterium]